MPRYCAPRHPSAAAGRPHSDRIPAAATVGAGAILACAQIASDGLSADSGTPSHLAQRIPNRRQRDHTLISRSPPGIYRCALARATRRRSLWQPSLLGGRSAVCSAGSALGLRHRVSERAGYRCSDAGEHAMFTDQQTLQCLSKVLHYMKAVRHLHCLRRALACALSKRPSSVATHHFQSRCHGAAVSAIGQGRRFSIRQQVKDAVLFEVHQERPIAQPTPEGEIIDTQHPQVGSDLAHAGQVRPSNEA